MPKYVLKYFNGRGRAEIARLLFAVAEQEYEDIRYTFDEWNTTIKEQTPQKQLPLLECDGKRISQSGAINLFLAHQLGLHGSNPIEGGQIDTVIFTNEEFMNNHVLKYYSEKDEEKKAEMLTEFSEKTIPKYYDLFDKMLADNETNSGWFVGEKISLADICMYNTLCWIEEGIFAKKQDMIPPLPERFRNHREKVLKVKQIADWIEKRPKTEW